MSQVQTGFDPHLQQDAPEQSRTRPSMWLLLLLAIAIALWWMVGQQRQAAPEPASLPATTALPAPIDATDATDAPVAVATAPARQPARVVARAAPRDRAPSLIASSRVMPKYPASALRAGETGVVTVAATIDANGVPIEVGIDHRSGNRDLDRAAVAAVKRWRFEPATRNGKPVQGTVHVPVEFALDRG